MEPLDLDGNRGVVEGPQSWSPNGPQSKVSSRLGGPASSKAAARCGEARSSSVPSTISSRRGEIRSMSAVGVYQSPAATIRRLTHSGRSACRRRTWRTSRRRPATGTLTAAFRRGDAIIPSIPVSPDLWPPRSLASLRPGDPATGSETSPGPRLAPNCSVPAKLLPSCSGRPACCASCIIRRAACPSRGVGDNWYLGARETPLPCLRLVTPLEFHGLGRRFRGRRATGACVGRGAACQIPIVWCRPVAGPGVVPSRNWPIWRATASGSSSIDST